MQKIKFNKKLLKPPSWKKVLIVFIVFFKLRKFFQFDKNVLKEVKVV